MIDPAKRTIEVYETPGGLQALYDALSFEGQPKVDDINAVQLAASPDIVTMWVDGEGFLKPDVPVFYLRGSHQPYAGRALLLGTDEEGEDVSLGNFEASLITTRLVVRWSDKVTAGDLGPSSQGRLGDGTFVFRAGDHLLKDKEPTP